MMDNESVASRSQKSSANLSAANINDRHSDMGSSLMRKRRYRELDKNWDLINDAQSDTL